MCGPGQVSAADPVAVRLAGGGVVETATAGKPDCYRSMVAARICLGRIQQQRGREG